MNIGVFLGDLDAKIGGGFTFQDSIFSALLNTKCEHKFYVFYFGDVIFDTNSSFVFIPLLKPLKFIKNKLLKRILIKFLGNYLINKALTANKIEIIWLLVPAYIKVNTPFVFPVWDLAHRVNPYFPEVSVTGWKWDKREQLYDYAVPRASYVIAGTEAGKGEITNFYNIQEERVKVIPFPTPSFAINAEKTEEDLLKQYNISRNYLFYPAQFWPHKNHISILTALKILKEKYLLDFDVVFTGSDKGNLKYIKEKTEELNLSENIHFLDFVSVDVLIELYRNAFALVFPTYFGPDNLPPLEALALGCPVIASNLSGAKEQLSDLAILINPQTPEEIASAVLKLYKDPECRNYMIEKGLKCSKKFTAQDYVNNVISIFEEFKSIRSCWSSNESYIEIR